jgi:membrane protease YdiL (CAAX protease family)
MYVAMLQGNQWKDLLLNTLAICIAPAIIEEIFFRGCLQQLFANWLRKNQWIGIIIVAIIFSAFHGQLNAFLPRFFLGLLLGIIYHFTSNLWITILVHFLNNFMTILMMYLYNAAISKINPLEMGDVSILVGIASGIITLAVAYYLYTQRKTFVISEVEKELLEID